MAKRKWIQAAIGKDGRGKLHEHLGISKGEKIPEEKLNQAMNSKNPTIRKEANLAKTLKHFHPAAKKKSGAELLYGHKAKE